MVAAVVLLASACSPTFNWREVPMGADAELVALLPCKPDRAQRDLPLGNQSVAVDMIGCEAGGATFAVARVGARDMTQARDWLVAWRTQVHAQWAGGRVEERPASVPRASESPPPIRIDASSSDEGAQKQQLHQLWFAHQHRNGNVALYQATVLGTPSSAEAIPTFFEGLHLP